MDFTHESRTQRVRFGSGIAATALAEEVKRLDANRIMVIASTTEQERAHAVTDQIVPVLTYSDVVMHVPVKVADRARDAAKAHDIDLIVCIGGGSSTGLAKAIALTSGIPIIAIPTTYAGSEATNVWGLTEGTAKKTGIDDRVLPQVIIYDAELTWSLPVELSVASGLNAIAHCVDSMWAPRANPINQALATEAIRRLRSGLRGITAANPAAARENALLGAYLSAVAFSSAGSGLHHKFCHVLGGAFNLPHAQTHAVVLPYVLAFNAPAAPEAERMLATAFGAPTALAGLQQLRAELNAPAALKNYGFAEADIPQAAQAILPAVPPTNPRSVTAADLESLLHDAWQGADPR